MKHTIESWKDCRDPRNVEYTAIHAGCHVRKGKGSHKIIEAPNGQKQPFYEDEISTGVACKLFKWFQENHIIVLALGAIISAAVYTLVM